MGALWREGDKGFRLRMLGVLYDGKKWFRDEKDE